MKADAMEVKISISADEFSFIFTRHLANKEQFKKLTKIRAKLLRERPNFKRVNLVLTLDDLDALLVNISRAANEGNVSEQDQYILDSLCGKLSYKHGFSLR